MSTRTTTKPTTKPTAKPAAKPVTKAVEVKDADVAAERSSPAEPQAEASQPAEKKTRQQLTVVLSVDISQARCATHLKQNLGDEEIEGEIKELRKELKAAKAAGDGREAEIKAKIAELSKALVRISSGAPIAAAVVCDFTVKELLRYGMDQAIASDRKIVEVGHYHDGDPTAMRCYPLVNKLPTFAGYDPEHEEELRKERAAANKSAKEAREAKKAAAEDKKGAKAPNGRVPARAAAKAAEPAEEEAGEEDEHGEHGEHTKTTFNTYVENALKTVKKEAPYNTMRVSNRVREDLSDIVAELLARLADLARILVQRVMNVRTMNADHIKAIVHLLMADEGRTEPQIGEITGQIDEKLKLYHDHLESEKSKKAAGLGAEKKAELESKRLEAELLRKKKQAELAKKRAVELAQKAKDFSAESARLEPIVAAHHAAAAAKAASGAEAPAGSEVDDLLAAI